MTRRLAAGGVFAAAAILRLHGAWSAPPLSGFDGPYHAANIGILVFEGRLPLPHEGWSTFHPPLYYALCALVWKLLPDGASAHTVLFGMRLVGVIASLGLGLAVYASARRLLPRRPWVALYAAAIALFVPMHVAPSFLLGNEMLAAALSALSVWLLLRCLAEPAAVLRAAALGAALGLAALTKFNALVVLAVAGGSLGVRAVRGAGWRDPALRSAAVACAVALLVGGWYYARNIALYGTPVVMQNEIVTEHMRRQGYGPTRPLADYVSLRPDLLRDPSDASAAARRAVWPATFAAVWFDPQGATLDPRAPWVRRLAWWLFLCGAVFTAAACGGALAFARKRVETAVPGGGGALLGLAAVMLAAYAVFTWRVATFSALKGSYLSPALPAFAILAGVGLDRAAGAAAAVRGLLALFVAAVAVLFAGAGLAPRPIDPATAYLLAYRDAPTQRVYDFFVRDGRPR